MTAEDILRNNNPFSVEIGEFRSEYVVSFDDATHAMKEYAKHKLDEAIQLAYHLDGDSDEKVVDVMDLIEIKNKI